MSSQSHLLVVATSDARRALSICHRLACCRGFIAYVRISRVAQGTRKVTALLNELQMIARIHSAEFFRLQDISKRKRVVRVCNPLHRAAEIEPAFSLSQNN